MPGEVATAPGGPPPAPRADRAIPPAEKLPQGTGPVRGAPRIQPAGLSAAGTASVAVVRPPEASGASTGTAGARSRCRTKAGRNPWTRSDQRGVRSAKPARPAKNCTTATVVASTNAPQTIPSPREDSGCGSRPDAVVGTELVSRCLDLFMTPLSYPIPGPVPGEEVTTRRGLGRNARSGGRSARRRIALGPARGARYNRRVTRPAMTARPDSNDPQ